jgi:cation transport regulator ChaB
VVHPEDAAGRERLAMGLFNTQIDAKAEDDLARRDDLLEELRALAVAHPEDAAVREQLARGTVQHLELCQGRGRPGAAR